jgi:hypothetical protein
MVERCAIGLTYGLGATGGAVARPAWVEVASAVEEAVGVGSRGAGRRGMGSGSVPAVVARCKAFAKLGVTGAEGGVGFNSNGGAFRVGPTLVALNDASAKTSSRMRRCIIDGQAPPALGTRVRSPPAIGPHRRLASPS